ncbi:MAG TPA: DUF4191 domain-containing protein [Candidatus Lustribacter sp.]|nr:DUF4191 domain-containing protein [Candidatus Lustribacter sp.]
MAKDSPATAPAKRSLFSRRSARGPAKGPGRLAQVRQVYTSSRAVDPAITWWMLGASLGILAIALVIGLLTHAPVYALVLGLPMALLAATIVLSRRAERAAYRQIEGQPGAAGAALSSLRRGWFVEEQPVAADAARPGDVAHAAIVFRALGRPGIVLVGEGPSARAQRLLIAERKKVERVAPGVPVTTLRIGDGGGTDEIAIRKLTSHVQRMKPVLTKDEVITVNKRLRALGGLRTAIPAGIDPTKVRMDRKAMRGR